MGARGLPVRFLLEGDLESGFTLGRHSSESAERVTLRAIVRALFPDMDLVPGDELCRGLEPIWRLCTPGGRDALQLFAGPRRSGKAQADRCWWVRPGQPGEEPGRDEVLVEAGFVTELANLLARRNTWRFERSGEHLEVRVGERTLVGRVQGLP